MMNIVSSCSFACTASLIYKRKRTFAGAATGVAVGWLVMAGVMLLWNYCIAPIYMGYPREAVATLLLPAFLPFNLIKGGLNAAITLLLYKPIWAAFSRSKLIEEHETEERTKKASVGILLFTGAIFLSGVILALALSGII